MCDASNARRLGHLDPRHTCLFVCDLQVDLLKTSTKSSEFVKSKQWHSQKFALASENPQFCLKKLLF
jgi:hypothetical protein